MIITKEVKDLTATEYRACYLANFRTYGLMQEELAMCREGEPGIAIMIWEGSPNKVASLKGWALITPTNNSQHLGATKHTRRVAKYTAQFWVKQQYRGMGLGKTLMREVTKHDPKPHVFPHSKKAVKLFSSFSVTTTAGYRGWKNR